MAQLPPPIPSGDRPYTDSIAQIEGSLTHVFLSTRENGGVRVFSNGEAVQADLFESLSVEIVAPYDSQDGILAATLSRYSAPGGGSPQGSSIFPGTVEVIGGGKRISITCTDLNSFDGLFLRFGLGEDGAGSDALGVAKFRLVVTPDLQDALLTWVEDGREDVILTS